MDSSFKNKKIIKVCKIDNFEFAKYAIHSGVAYLGVHILEENNFGKHLDLIRYIKNSKGEVVVVTKVHEYTSLKKIIEYYEPHGLQLHFSPDLELLRLLKKNHPRIKIFPVVTSQTSTDLVKELSAYSEKIVYDTSFVGGTGARNDLTLLSQLPDLILQKILIAGGVDLEIVKNNLSTSVAGFDIQSYFRDGENRFFSRLESIFRELEYTKFNKLSVSLTDVSLNDIDQVLLYQSQPQTNYHLDYSDGSLYKNFITGKAETIDKSVKLKKYPHTVHIFQNSIDSINNSIDEFIRNNPYSIVSFFVQYFSGADFNLLNAKTNPTISVYYKDIIEYLQKYGAKFKYLSVILPSDDIDKSHEIIDYINKHADILNGVEIWFDRELTAEKIRIIKERSILPFNAIVGKEITKNWSNLPLIYEQLSI